MVRKLQAAAHGVDSPEAPSGTFPKWQLRFGTELSYMGAAQKEPTKAGKIERSRARDMERMRTDYIKLNQNIWYYMIIFHISLYSTVLN